MPDLLFTPVKVNLGAAMLSVHCMSVIYNFNLFWVFEKNTSALFRAYEIFSTM
jgi:hypothetical protein